MREVEILYNLEESIKKALNKCICLNGDNFCIDKVHDIYYKTKPRTSLRLRHNDIGQIIYSDIGQMTYKEDVYKGKEWIYSNEYETEIDLKNAIKVFDKLFKRDVELKIRKYIFNFGKYKVIIEKVQGLGNFLEVERQGKVSNIDKAKQEIRYIVKMLGIKVGKELNQGKPELMRNK